MALIRKGKVSLSTFAGGFSIFLVPFLGVIFTRFQDLWQNYWFFIICLYCCVYNAVLYFLYNLVQNEKSLYQVAVRSGFLGLVHGLGLLVSYSDTTWTHFGWYITALSFFHFSEYFTTALTNPRSLTLESFLLDHSLEYKLAAFASWLEFSIEWFFSPGLKQTHLISMCGLLLVVVGEVIRKLSMFTASTNFNHYVQYIKQEGHTLVTHGVYSWCRHPSYVGWFFWSIGTQIVLCNPVCLVAYTIVSWRFFRERIHDEEIFLINFFGEEYVDYQKRVGTGLPFIEGYTGGK